MKINFLSAFVPLTKGFTRTADGNILKEPYPLVFNVTSHTSDNITTLSEFFKLIKSNAAQGYCLLKGTLNRELDQESRKGTTRTEDTTSWVCLDFDRCRPTLPITTELDINEELVKLGLGDVSYILQWSSSQGMPGTEGTLSCHVFMLLSAPMGAPTLKAWLQSLNFEHFSEQISLTRNHAGLRWPLDITTCQNDKLLYIATPVFIGMQDPLADTQRLSLIKRLNGKIPVARIAPAAQETLRKQELNTKNALRKKMGMPITKACIQFVGESEVQNKPGQATVTGIKDCGEFVRINLNEGDSWAYWHHKESFELLYNFKGEYVYRLKELCPAYYANLAAQRVTKNSEPDPEGNLVLAFRDLRTAQYWNGTWNKDAETLTINVARSETQLDHFLQAHGKTSGSFVPIWNIEYLPNEDFIIDQPTRRINTFKRSEYMRSAQPRKVDLRKECPLINRLIENICGNDEKVSTEFLHWFACVFQLKGKPTTSWTFHGIEGTGKGLFFHAIARPILHPSNCFMGSIATLEDGFNDWMIGKLFILIDEIDVDDFTEKGKVTSKLRSYITEPTFPVRAMRISPYEADNRFVIMFASNRPQPVYIPASDRRHNIGRFQSKKLDLTDDEIKNHLPDELQAFADYLAGLTTSVTRASQICHTPDRDRIAKLAVNSIQETANALINGDLEALWAAMPDERHLAAINTLSLHNIYASAYADLLRTIAKDHIDGHTHYEKITREELRTIFQYCVGNTPETPNKFTSLLRHCGIEIKRIRRHKIMNQGVEISWAISEEFREFLKTTIVSKLQLRAVK